MKKKRWICFVAAAVAAAMTACGSGEKAADVKETPQTEAAKKEAAKPETTEAETAREETTKEETTEEETAKAQEETEGKSSGFQTGTWDGLTFTNPWLGISITMPEGSYVFTEEDMEAVLGAGKEVMINNGTYTDTQMEMSDALTIYDFMASLPDGQSSVQLACENTTVTTMGKGISEEEYLDAVSAQLLTIADMQYEFGEKEEVELGGKKFVKLSGKLMGGAMYQDYYCISLDKRMAVMTVSYVPEGQADVEELIAGITAAP
jgi:hypothetical protein